jgi:aconitate hydratase
VSLTLQAPTGDELPKNGFVPDFVGYLAPSAEGRSVEVAIDPKSTRLERLAPFPAWDGTDPSGLVVLLKARGKCTTDHISAAGKWLTYRGHLENISGNLFLGAINAYGDHYEAGHGKDVRDGSVDTYPNLAKKYSEAGIRWTAIGDRNYGEGSSREHAAMEPRFRGGVVIFARSFARIHETNLKKQGLVPLTFADPATYDTIGEDDRINVLGLPPVPGTDVRCQVVGPDGAVKSEFSAKHTFSDEQVEWFKAGSALNVVRRKVADSAKG